MAKTGNKGKKQSSSKKSDIGFSIENIDRKVDPLVDFYSYANGSWIRKNEVPDDKVSLGWNNIARLLAYKKSGSGMHF